LYTGPKGRCGDCGKPTFIRLGSMVGKVREDNWDIHPELLHVMYADVRKSTMRLSRGKLIARCLACLEDPRTRENAVGKNISKLIWVAMEGAVGDDPSGMLVGPFCNVCFRSRRRKFESQAGLPVDLPVYYMTISDKSLALVVDTPEPVEIPPSDPSHHGEDDGSGTSEVEGMF
jgi:hypothetical protein